MINNTLSLQNLTNQCLNVINTMKQIDIVVTNERLLDVNTVLYRHKVGGLMSFDIKGRGRAKRKEEPVIVDSYYYGKKNVPEFASRTKIEAMVSDRQVKEIIDDLIKTLSTGSASDGKIFVKDVLEVYDIGLKQVGEIAL
jgi:nitrogen regulatory protein P-II 1